MATPLTGDTRLVQFTYDEDNTFLVLAKPKAVTHLQFAADETLQSVASGDTAQWELTPTKNRKNLFIKPKFDGIETSMTVITDKRTYQFVLRSTADGKKWYQRVSWMYATSLVLEQDAVLDAMTSGGLTMPPVEALPRPPIQARHPEPSSPATNATGTLRPDSLRFNYKIEGDATFKPTQVFDDGKFTYLRMPQEVQELPALFSVVEGQEYALVNYTIDGNYLIAQRLLDTAVLKLGKAEVRVNKVVPSSGFTLFNRGGPTK
ncbi:MAG: TrbG/VirB9 family P-type conjugative transfer protein [Rhodoferax sp.]|nr:TrbG/VirB9 family P-type conjugative transfer protein [Rhodoferax sp.]